MLEAYSNKSGPDEITIKSILFEDLHQMFPEYSTTNTMVVINKVLNEYGLHNIGSMTLWNVYARIELMTRCQNIIKEN